MNLKIFNKDVPLLNLCFVIGEGLLIYSAILIAAFVRFGSIEASFLSPDVLGKAFLIMIVCQGSLYYNELYNLRVTDTYLELGLRLTKAMGISSIILALIYYFIPSLLLGRGIFFVSLIFLVLLVVPWRYVYNWILKKRMFAEKLLILGSGTLCGQIIDEIQFRPDCGYQIAGVMPSDSASEPLGMTASGIPVYSHDGSLCQLAATLQATIIAVVMGERRGKLPTKELLRCKVDGIKVLEGATFYEELTGKLSIEKLNPSWLIFSDGFRKSLLTRFSKRGIGLVGSSIALLITLPLICLIAVAIKLDSKGPVFFRQERCGQDGVPFKIYKFRSMIDKAEAQTGPQWATDDDPRITRVGAILRKYRLDEIPQLWNVLKGDMSFVGPRPERPEFVKMLTEKIPYYSERHTVKPGISGWAQVSYRYGASVDDALEKLKYDLFYVKNMSFALDLLIMFKTIKIILLQSGAR